MSKKNKIIISVCVPLAVVIILITILLPILLLKPTKAKNVEVVANANQIVVKTSVIEKERTYKFKFVSVDGEKVFDSQSHVFDITELLWTNELKLGTEYEVSVCLVDKSGILAGDFGEAFRFVPELTLDQVQKVTYNEQTNSLEWQSVRGADGYNIYYNLEDQLVKAVSEQTSFSLADVVGGERNIFVTAYSNNEFLHESDKSNTVSLVVEHQIAEISSAKIDLENNLVIECSEKLNGIELFDEISQTTYSISIGSVTALSNGYRMTYSLKGIVTTGHTFTVKPLSWSHNTFSGQATSVQGVIA